MGWFDLLTTKIFKNLGGRFSGRYQNRNSYYMQTDQWMYDVPDLSQYPDPYAKDINQYLSPYDEYRLQLYKFNRALYKGDHYNAFRFAQYLYRSGMIDDDVRLSEIFGDNGIDVLFIACNLFELVTDTYADLMAEALSYIAPEEDSPEARDAIKRISKNSDIKQLIHRSVTTGSYKGDIIFTVHGRSATAGTGNNASPGGSRVWIRGRRADTWFPTIDPQDRTRFVEHTFMSQIREGKKTYVTRERYAADGIHYDVKELEGNTFTGAGPDDIYKKVFGEIEPFIEYPEDLSMEDMVVHCPNKVGDDNDPYGDSDYGRAVITLADELNHRLTQLGHQLDKHADLGMTGPELGGDEVTNPDDDNRTNRGASGKYIARDSADDPEPKYIEIPTSHFETIMREIEFMLEEICRQTHMSPRLLGYKKGAAEESFDTLRLACVTTLLRNKGRIIYLDSAIERAFEAAARLEKTLDIEGAIDDLEIEIKWGDGFPVDEEKRARTWGLRTGNKQTATVKQAIKDMDGPDGAEDTLEEIQAETNKELSGLPGLGKGRMPNINLDAAELEARGEQAPLPKEPEINAGQEPKGQPVQGR